MADIRKKDPLDFEAIGRAAFDYFAWRTRADVLQYRTNLAALFDRLEEQGCIRREVGVTIVQDHVP